MRKDFHLIKPNVDIVLHCSDWSGEYKVKGRMIPYKKPKGQKISRFCTQSGFRGEWESNHKEWSQREGWEYAEEKGGEG